MSPEKIFSPPFSDFIRILFKVLRHLALKSIRSKLNQYVIGNGSNGLAFKVGFTFNGKLKLKSDSKLDIIHRNGLLDDEWNSIETEEQFNINAQLLDESLHSDDEENKTSKPAWL